MTLATWTGKRQRYILKLWKLPFFKHNTKSNFFTLLFGNFVCRISKSTSLAGEGPKSHKYQSSINRNGITHSIADWFPGIYRMLGSTAVFADVDLLNRNGWEVGNWRWLKQSPCAICNVLCRLCTLCMET